MPLKFDAAEKQVMDRLLAMGTVAERMMKNVISSLVDRKPELLQKVYEDEQQMDSYQCDIDECIVEMIGVYTPVAADLRFLLMASRINGELERIGDQAVNIGHIVEDLVTNEPLKPYVDLPKMAEQSQAMLHHAIHAFASRSVDEAMQVMKMDNGVDSLYDKLFDELIEYMDSNPKSARKALALLLTCRSVERVADRAVNIAEDVIYTVTGKDIRHLHPEKEPAA